MQNLFTFYIFIAFFYLQFHYIIFIYFHRCISHILPTFIFLNKLNFFLNFLLWFFFYAIYFKNHSLLFFSTYFSVISVEAIMSSTSPGSAPQKLTNQQRGGRMIRRSIMTWIRCLPITTKDLLFQTVYLFIYFLFYFHIYFIFYLYFSNFIVILIGEILYYWINMN